MEIVEHIYHYGYDLQHFCRELLQYFRNLILMKVSQKPEGLMEMPKEEFEILKRQAERFQFDQINLLFSILLKGEEEVVQSTFPRIILEMTLIRMATLRPILPIDEILKKLESLGKAEYLSVEPVEERLEVIEEIEGQAEEKTMDPNNSQKETSGRGESQKVWDETWKGLVDLTRARNPILGSFLTLGNLVHMSDEKIEIGFEKGSFHYDRMIEKENRNQLESICQDYFQRKMKVIISPLDQGVVLKGRAFLEAGETAQNPLVQETLRLFNGRIVKS
jgi:DNA polymerase-3 subunit gamma/tau